MSILLLIAPASSASWQEVKKQEAPDQSEIAKKAEALVQVAIISCSASDEKLGLDSLSEAMHLWIELHEPDKAARSALLVGDTYQRVDRVREGFYCYNQALEVKPLSNQVSGLVFYSAAKLYAKFYQPDLAKTYYEKAVVQARAAKDVSLQAEVLGGLAALYYQTKEWKQALACIGQVQQLNRQPVNAELNALCLLLSGQIAQEQGDKDSARKALNEAFTFYQRTHNVAGQGKALSSISALFFSSGQLYEALNSAQQALKLAATQRPSSELWSWDWRAYLAQARAQSALGKKDEARKSYIHAVGFLNGIWIDTISKTTTGSVAFDEEGQAAIREYLDILIELGRLNDAYEMLERAKARTLSSLIVGRRKAGSHQLKEQDEALREQAQAIASQRTQLLLPTISSAQRAEIEKEIAKSESEMAEARTKAEINRGLMWVRSLSLDQVQKHLSGDQKCLIEFSLGECRSFVWLIDSDNIAIEILPGRQEIEKAIEPYLTAINTRPNNLYLDRDLHTQRVMAERIFTRLFGHLAGRLTPNKRLIIVPDGVLYYLPFEALIQNGHYLIEDHEISYIPSANLYGLFREAKSDAKPEDRMELLAFGDPIFDLYEAKGKHADTTDQTIAKARLRAAEGFHLVALPRTRDEVEDIGNFFAPDRRRVYLGKDSTEDTVKAETLRRYKRLHFATHSLVDEQHPNRSAVVLSLDTDPREDGFLEVDEIADLDLDADLVVLSACQTGRGKLFSGEGIVGLSRAFLYAGARSVAVSLWNVSDVSTSQFMKDFYQHLVQGMGNAAALREAKLKMLRGGKETQHPFYWAPFVITGKP